MYVPIETIMQRTSKGTYDPSVKSTGSAGHSVVPTGPKKPSLKLFKRQNSIALSSNDNNSVHSTINKSLGRSSPRQSPILPNKTYSIPFFLEYISRLSSEFINHENENGFIPRTRHNSITSIGTNNSNTNSDVPSPSHHSDVQSPRSESSYSTNSLLYNSIPPLLLSKQKLSSSGNLNDSENTYTKKKNDVPPSVLRIHSLLSKASNNNNMTNNEPNKEPLIRENMSVQSFSDLSISVAQSESSIYNEDYEQNALYIPYEYQP